MPWDSVDNRLTRSRTLADEIQAQIRKAINHRPAAPATVAYGSLVYGDTTPGSGQKDVAFLDLTDTPDTYVGQANKIVAVNAGETAVEFIAPAGTNYWFRRGTALEPINAGDTVSYSANSTTALKVEQNGVHDDTLIVDTTNGAVGMTADVTVTGGTVTVDVANEIAEYIDSDILNTANLTAADKIDIDELISGTDPGAFGTRTITSTTFDDNFTIDFSAITSAGAKGADTYTWLDFDLNVAASQSGVSDQIAVNVIDVDLAQTLGGLGVASTFTGNYINLKKLTVPIFTVSVAGVVTAATSLSIAGGTALTTTNRTGTGNLVLENTPTLVTPVIGVATGTSLAATGLITSSSATAGIGYATGAGSTVSQGTSKSTGVTINAICGTITTHNATLNAATIVSFQVTNSACAATDVIVIQHDSGGTVGAYTVMPNGSAAGHFHVTLRNNTAGNLGEALVLRYAIIKAVIS